MNDMSQLADARSAFYEEIRNHGLAPLWNVLHGLVPRQPASRIVPAIWHYDRIRPYLMRSGALISAEEAERRVLILENPACPGESKITGTLYAGMQLILPGEVAPRHRHTQTALRFVIEGDGAFTSVDGERAVMRPFDLVLTPNWHWHDHGNETQDPMVWLDGLDIPILQFFDAGFAETASDQQQNLCRPTGDSRARFGKNMLPIGYEAQKTSPVFHYPYQEYRQALDDMKAGTHWDAHHGLKLEFINPATGGPMTPTLSGFTQMVPKGMTTQPYQATDGMIVTGVEGRGKITMGDQSFEIGPRDVCVIPSWRAHTIAAESDDLVLFIFSDKGMQQALGIWREARIVA